MLNKEDNDLLTLTNPGTTGGAFMRRFWQPVALSEELAPSGAPLSLRILGEDLVLFRDEQGRLGLMELYCPHRGVDLSYGRIEDGGLRCLYHGWLFDVCGNCLEQPGEPEGGSFHKSVRQISYPCHEAGGLIFAYMGPGEPPTFPKYDFLRVPETHVGVVKMIQESNYLQGLEGNFDQVHLSFLHRILDKRDVAEDGIVKGSQFSSSDLLKRDTVPVIETEETGFGMREYVIRKSGDGGFYLKVENFVLPALCAVPGNRLGQEGYLINWYVPIDDTHHWKYQITFSTTDPIDKATYKKDVKDELDAGYQMKRNKRNRFMQDRESMKTEAYTGLGNTFAVHDAWAAESMRPINDRSKEHLGYEDKSVILMRKILLQIMRELREKGDAYTIPKGTNEGLSELIVLAEVVPEVVDWKEYLRNKLQQQNR